MTHQDKTDNLRRQFEFLRKIESQHWRDEFAKASYQGSGPEDPKGTRETKLLKKATQSHGRLTHSKGASARQARRIAAENRIATLAGTSNLVLDYPGMKQSFRLLVAFVAILPNLACDDSSATPTDETLPNDAVERPTLSVEDCEKTGYVVGDPGDGRTHRADFVCPDGAAPIGNVALPIEGAACCPGEAPEPSAGS